MTQTCTAERLVVETEKGTYTIDHGSMEMGKCAADRKCAESGGVLAPFKSRYDAFSLFVNLAVARNS